MMAGGQSSPSLAEHGQCAHYSRLAMGCRWSRTQISALAGI